MPTTEPIYGWPLPEDTDPLADGAAAIRNLSHAIAATLKGHLRQLAELYGAAVIAGATSPTRSGEIFGTINFTARAGFDYYCRYEVWGYNAAASAISWTLDIQLDAGTAQSNSLTMPATKADSILGECKFASLSAGTHTARLSSSPGITLNGTQAMHMLILERAQ